MTALTSASEGTELFRSNWKRNPGLADGSSEEATFRLAFHRCNRPCIAIFIDFLFLYIRAIQVGSISTLIATKLCHRFHIISSSVPSTTKWYLCMNKKAFARFNTTVYFSCGRREMKHPRIISVVKSHATKEPSTPYGQVVGAPLCARSLTSNGCSLVPRRYQGTLLRLFQPTMVPPRKTMIQATKLAYVCQSNALISWDQKS